MADLWFKFKHMVYVNYFHIHSDDSCIIPDATLSEDYTGIIAADLAWLQPKRTCCH